MRPLFLSLLIALAVGSAGSQSGPSGLSNDLQQLIQTGGKAYADVLLAQSADQAQCTANQNKLPASAIGPFMEAQRSTLKLPANGQLMGDWRQGDTIFNTLARGNCFSCHLGSPRNLGGNVGPSLEQYGQRGQSEAVQRYTYEVVYNPWVYYPCTVMYRFGHQGLLKPEEVAHVVAYLLDPASDFNTRPALKK